MKEPEDDTEAVEYCRKNMQDTIDRCDWEAGSVDAMLDSTGTPHEAMQVFDHELRPIGQFDLELPEHIMQRFPAYMRHTVLRHFVYRHKDGQLFVIHYPRRIELMRRGVVTLHAFVKRPDN